jgi:hypothetical protein
VQKYYSNLYDLIYQKNSRQAYIDRLAYALFEKINSAVQMYADEFVFSKYELISRQSAN